MAAAGSAAAANFATGAVGGAAGMHEAQAAGGATGMHEAQAAGGATGGAAAAFNMYALQEVAGGAAAA